MALTQLFRLKIREMFYRDNHRDIVLRFIIRIMFVVRHMLTLSIKRSKKSFVRSNLGIVSLEPFLFGVLSHSRDIIMDIVSLELAVKVLRMVKRMVIVSMQPNEMSFLKANFDFVSKLMENLMVIVSMKGKLVNLKPEIYLESRFTSVFKRDLREF